jgi:hypothetical protein
MLPIELIANAAHTGLGVEVSVPFATEDEPAAPKSIASATVQSTDPVRFLMDSRTDITCRQRVRRSLSVALVPDVLRNGHVQPDVDLFAVHAILR